MIPILYDSNTTNFNNNGLGRLRDCINCEVIEERNTGVYECNFDYPVIGANFSAIQCGRIIGVLHDDTNDVQPFDIVSYSKPINGVVSFHAVHISYRLRGYTVSGTNINSLSDALTMLSNAEPTCPFTFTADYTSTAYMAAADGTPRSVRQMLGGIEGSILDTYGGEYEFDKFNVILHGSRGTDKDFKIRYGVNMINYDEDIDYSNAYISCIPYWVGDNGEGVQTLVKGDKVNSGLTPYNGHDCCIPLDLTTKFEYMPSAAELEQKALQLMTSGNVNLPTQTIEVDFVRLQDFDEYGQFGNLLSCALCDRIEVIFPDYNTSGRFKIVKTVYDVLNERYIKMELGTLATTLAQALGITDALPAQNGGGGGGSAAPYGVCSTAASTAAKVVTVTPNISEITTGTLIYVKFDNSNTVANPTLTVNAISTASIKRYGTTAPSTSADSSWNAGAVLALLYDGTYWQIVGWLNTTYSSMTVAEYQAGTSTSERLITPANLKGAIDYWVDVTPIISSGTKIATVKTGDTSTDLYAPTSGGGGVADVQVNGTSVVVSNVANVPVAKADVFGVIKIVPDNDPPGGVVKITYRNSVNMESNIYAPLTVYSGGEYQPIRAKFLPDATQSTKGAMSAADKTKLDGIGAMVGATASADGTGGLVPAPLSGKQLDYLFGDGTWDHLYFIAYHQSNNILITEEKYHTGDTIQQITLNAATQTVSGVMSAADKTKLDNMALIVYPIGSVWTTTDGTLVPGTMSWPLQGTWAALGTNVITSADLLETSDGYGLETSDGQGLGFDIITYQFTRTA